jgi:broad specificity phosphatase PhoE
MKPSTSSWAFSDALHLQGQEYSSIDTKLWLVRHGQTDWNLAGRWQGQAPDAPGLNEMGHAQALTIREQLRGERLAAVYSSDLLRARQTSELIAQPLGLTVTLDTRLREINLGAWEGMLSEEIEARYPQELAERARKPFATRAPDGESPLEVAERVLVAINEIATKHAGESILVVAHGVSLAVIICHTQGFPMEDVYQHIPGNLQPYLVRWHP